MITIISGLFIFIGASMMMIHIFVPMTIADWQSGMVTAYNISGFIFLFIGVVILFARGKQTGGFSLFNLPKEDEIKCFVQPGHSSNTKIIEGKLLTDNVIKTKNDMLVNYKGGGFRIAGHECVRIHGNVASNIPEWLGELIARYREKFKVHNIVRLKQLSDQLQALSYDEPLLTQLKEIPLLQDALDDPKTRNQLLDMSVKDFHGLSEEMWDGTVVRLDPDIDEFVQTATPAYVDQYAKKEYMKKKNRDVFVKSRGSEIDWGKWALPIGILIFLMLMGAGIMFQMAGS